jgi:tRNA A-37 threonylcarbamoyl transferase component Bud32
MLTISAETPPSLKEMASVLSPLRVRREAWHGRKVWVKQATRPKATIFHKIQQVLCRLIPIEGFRPTVTAGGAAALHHEAYRIAELRKAGFVVPEVLARSDEWLVLSDLGLTVDRHFSEQANLSADDVRDVISACGRELARLHMAGQCHGRAKINDFIVTHGGEIGFIDFEEDVSHLSPASIQAREIWLFLCGASRYTKIAPNILPVAFGAYREARGNADFTELKKMLKVLKLFNWTVYPWRWILSADVNRAYAATDFLLKAKL